MTEGGFDHALRALDAAEDPLLPAGDATVRRLRQMLHLLSEFSPGRRGACPPRDDLVAWFDHRLAAEPAARMAAHLEACPICAADLADLAALARPPLFEALILTSAAGLRLLHHTFGQAQSPTPVPVRGTRSATMVELSAHNDDLELLVRVHSGPPGSADLRVQVRRTDGAPRARVNLLRDSDLLESRLATGADEVVFADVPLGDYALAVVPMTGDEVARITLRLVDQEPAT